MQCIWCKKNHSAPSVEHIIPEAIGCPPSLVLSNGEVCRKCNNRLSGVDRALLKEFEIVAFMHGILRKGGRKPTIDSTRNVWGEIRKDGPHIFFNMEKNSVTTDEGRKIASYRKGSGSVKSTILKKDGTNQISFEKKIGENNPKFLRGLTKIAFESFVYFGKEEEAQKDKYDHLRKYVLFGGTQRPVIVRPVVPYRYFHNVSKPIKTDNGNEYFAEVVLCGLRFTVDFCPDLQNFKVLKSRLEENTESTNGWTWLPIEA